MPIRTSRDRGRCVVPRQSPRECAVRGANRPYGTGKGVDYSGWMTRRYPRTSACLGKATFSYQQVWVTTVIGWLLSLLGWNLTGLTFPTKQPLLAIGDWISTLTVGVVIALLAPNRTLGGWDQSS